MEKPTYRYNHKTKELDRTYRITNEVLIGTGIINPQTGIENFIKTTYESSIYRMYKELRENMT